MIYFEKNGISKLKYMCFHALVIQRQRKYVRIKDIAETHSQVERAHSSTNGVVNEKKNEQVGDAYDQPLS